MRSILTIFVVCICLLSAKAQELGFKSFNLVENNRPVKINTIYKTDQGYIYAGTTNGLYSFDGINFKKINFAKPNVRDTVTAIFQDNTHQLWVGFKNGHLAKKVNSKLEYFEPEEGHPAVAITAFLQDKQNNIWFATNGEGIYHFSNDHLYLIDSANGLSDLHIHSLAQTDNGDMLAATDAGINICKSVNGKIKVSVLGPREGLPDYYVTAITAAGKNTFWIGLQDKGLCLYDHNSGKITVSPVDSNWKYGQINALLVSQKVLWIGTEEHGLLQKSMSDQPAIPFSKSVSANKITDLLQDNEGNIWSNTSTELKAIAGNQLQLFPVYDQSVFENIRAMLYDYQGNFWISSAGSLVKYTVTNGTFTKKDYHFAGLNNKTDIACLYQDINHHIWIGTMGGGILMLDPQTGKYRSLTENLLLKNASILSITGNGSTVCAGGLEGVAMIFDVDSSNRDITAHYRYTNYNNIDNIGSNYIIYSTYKDTHGRIWFGTGEKGITVFENGRFLHYGKENGLLDDHIFSFTEDKKGNIWFTTKSAGIYCFDGKTFKNYSAASGISDLEIVALKTGPLGNIILVNKKGIDILNVNSGTFSYFDNNEGIANVNSYSGAVAQDIKGNIAFCTAKGIVVYSPVENTTHQPKTIIENVQLFLSDVETDKAGDYNADQNTFQFYFTALYYTNPDEVRYQYKLEGLDTAWISTRDRNVSFLRLQPGKYKFHVRSSLNENFNGADEATYEFFIATPIWKRLWFIVLVVLLVGGLIYWYVKHREAQMKKMQLLQQEKIQFQFQVLRNQVNPHFLFNSFNTLISTIEEDPKMAVDYVEQLSEFFRNIVNYRDKDVISLEEELTVLQTYFYLQQKRYGGSLKLDIRIPEEVRENTFIPPLTLQLLLENAIKHNAVSKETLLNVELYTEDDKWLVISNNINPKLSSEASSGMGLQNIINRYNLLSSEPVKINNNGTNFTVTLPTLKQQ